MCAVCATMQKDLKRLVTYSSVAHMGFIVLGIFAITRLAITGSDASGTVALGAGLILAGGAVLVLRRRKAASLSL